MFLFQWCIKQANPEINKSERDTANHLHVFTIFFGGYRIL